MSKENKFYVYLHRRKSDGSVFYVGKGSGRRAWVFEKRNSYWARVFNKHGCEVDIFKDNMPEVCAFTLEKIMIAQYGIDSLCNITSGGDGNPTKKVWCSNGMSFESITLAADWVASWNNGKANIGHISDCANGKLNSSYGLNWSFDDLVGEPKNRKELLSGVITVPVYCSNGMVFKSVTSARDYLISIGHSNASTGSISVASRKEGSSCYGFSWSKTSVPEKPVGKGAVLARHFGKPIVCSNGSRFNSITEAETWVRIQTGNTKASRSNISMCCSGKGKTAYGYKWKYADV